MAMTTMPRWLPALLAALPPAAAAQGGPVPDVVPNFVGAGIGVTTRYSGADESVGGILPGYRRTFGPQGGRFVEWYGPLVSLNLHDGPGWQWGPALNLRFGRKDADDPAVAALPEVDATLEGGAWGAYTVVNLQGVPWRWRTGVHALADLGQDGNGANLSLWSSFWLPLSERTFVGVGGGLTWASGAYMRAYYGIDEAGAAASGLPVYQPGGGLRQWYAWPAVVHKLTPKWFVGASVFYQRLAGPAADSPIVRDAGDPNQWTYGVGIGYALD